MLKPVDVDVKQVSGIELELASRLLNNGETSSKRHSSTYRLEALVAVYTSHVAQASRD